MKIRMILAVLVMWATGTASPASAQWYFGAEAVMFSRSTPERLDLVADDDLPGDPVVLTTRSAEFDYDAGYRLRAGYQCNACDSIELVYMNVPQWQATGTVQASAGGLDSLETAASFFPEIAPNAGQAFNDFDSATIFYDTEVHSVELNSRRQMTDVATMIVGFRYLRVKDFMRITTEESAADDATFNGTRIYDINTENDLFGVQIGGELNRTLACHEPLSLGLKGMAGLLVGKAQQNQRNFTPTGVNVPIGIDTPAGFEYFTNGADEITYATTLELGVFADYALTNRLTLRAGYEIMFWSGLATAAEQLNDSTLGNEVHAAGIIVVDGFTAGVTYQF